MSLLFFSKLFLRGRIFDSANVLSILSVAIGSAVLFLTLGFVNSYVYTVELKMKSFMGDALVRPFNSELVSEKKIYQALTSIKEINQHFNFFHLQGVMAFEGRAAGILLEVVDLEFMKNHMKPQVEQGDLEKEGVSFLVGKELASRLDLNSGDEARVLFWQEQSKKEREHLVQNQKSSGAQIRKIKVTGIVDYGQYSYNERYVVMDFDSFKKKFGFQGNISGAKLIFKDSVNVDEFVKNTDIPGFFVRSWKSLAGNLFQAIQYEKIVLLVLLSILIIVAAFNLAISLFVGTLKKTAQISLLQALGASQSFLFWLFSLKGLLLGAIGLFLGFALSYLGLQGVLHFQNLFHILPEEVYSLSEMSVNHESLDIIILSALILLICWLSTVIPIMSALKRDIVRGLSFE